jgi:hypothetical protein
MGLRDRLVRIERLANEAIPTDRCTTCGFPSPRLVSPVLVVDEGEELPRCATCHRSVDHEGRSVIPEGAAGSGFRLKVRIRVREG